MEIKFDTNILQAAPGFSMILFEAGVQNPPTDDALWAEIEGCAALIKASTPMELVRHRPAIAATREAYKACGKDPNRYRPSAEALCRRAVKGLSLYRSLAIIDLVNLLSMETGHSIGAFDADKIDGDILTLGVGAEGEPYEAIGRGELNIAGLPVYRDATGGIGTPTSDNERTKLSADTRHLLVTLNIYGASPEADIDALIARMTAMLEKYASATDIRIHYYSACNEND